MKLYSYWRSSAAYRVRIALNFKRLKYDYVPVHLVKDGGEQHKPEYRALNPQGRVPALEDDAIVITQSMAILEYLEDRYPDPGLLPEDPLKRVFARQIANVIACDIHPLNNSGVLKYLGDTLGVDETGKLAWYRHWIEEGFKALETLLRNRSDKGPYCLGEEVSLADVCLVPQIYNARRFEVSLDPYPILRRVEENSLKLEPFQRAVPERQPDAPASESRT